MTALAARLRPHLARLAPTADAALLARFVATRDDDAFADLVRRHGPAVLAVCRRLTRDPHLADDAFQAVFLVLARRAAHVRRGEPLAAWLYGVAVRVARKAAARAARRREVCVGVADVSARTAEPFDPDAARAVLDEVGRLSPRYRAAVVLCELEGRSRPAAARELGIAEGTLSSRLAAARKQLAARLRDRGLAPVVLAAVAAERAAAVVRTPVSFTPGARELAEVAMRSGSAWWYGIGAAVAVIVAVGFSAGQEPPAPAPTPAPAAAQPVEDRSRLVVGMPGEVRYFTPAGEEVARLTNDTVRRARQTLLPPREVGMPRLNPAGRLTPDGRLPVLVAGEVWLLHPGPLAFRPARWEYPPSNPPPYLVAWSPTGKRAVARYNRGAAFGGDLLEYERIDFTGVAATERLPLPSGHEVADWSADGGWFLTVKHERRFNPRKGIVTFTTLCRVSRDGKTVEELAPKTDGLQHAAFAPDGERVAYLRRADDGGVSVVVLNLTTGTRRLVSEEAGSVNRLTNPVVVRWAPDGSRIGYAFGLQATVVTAGERPAFGMRVVTCAADGGDRREVFARDSDAAAGFTLFDWR